MKYFGVINNIINFKYFNSSIKRKVKDNACVLGKLPSTGLILPMLSQVIKLAYLIRNWSRY